MTDSFDLSTPWNEAILKTRVNELEQQLAEAQQTIERQAAQIEMMRVALQSAEWNSLDLPQFVVTQIVEALSSTPDQALEQFAANVR